MGSLGGTDDRVNADVWRLTAPLVVVIAMGTAVRLVLLDIVMRNDEVVTATRYALDLGTALTDYSAPNNHILHSILVNLSTSAFGWDPWAIRLPALLFGIGLIVAVDWWITSAAGRRDAGLLAAAFVAGSSLLIEYSVVARGYAMVAAAFVVLIELSRRLLLQPSTGRWVVWALVSVAGLVTVPVFVFPLLTVGVWMLLNVLAGRVVDKRATLLGLGVSSAIVIVFTVFTYLPAAAASGLEAIIDNPFVKAVPWSDLPYQWYRLTANLAVMVWRDEIGAILYGSLAIAAVVLNRALFGRLLTPVVGLVGPILLVVARQVAPPERVWLYVWALVMGLAGAALARALDHLPKRLRSNRLVAPIVAVAIATTMGLATVASGDVDRSSEGGAFHDGPAVADLLEPMVGARDRIVVESHPRWVLDYYLSPDTRRDPVLKRDFENAERAFVVVYHPREQDLEGVLATAGFPISEFSEPELRWQLPDTDIYVLERSP